jgi:metal-responsive CopG/Arc/MetJ family transcriptional regulator
MRTTINLDDDVLRIADRLAQSRSISRGEAISELARRAVRRIHPRFPIKRRNGFVVLDTGDAATFSSTDVNSALDNDDLGRARLRS